MNVKNRFHSTKEGAISASTRSNSLTFFVSQESANSTSFNHAPIIVVTSDESGNEYPIQDFFKVFQDPNKYDSYATQISVKLPEHLGLDFSGDDESLTEFKTGNLYLMSKKDPNNQYKNVNGIPIASFSDILFRYKSSIYGSMIIVIGVVFSLWFVQKTVYINGEYELFNKKKHSHLQPEFVLIPKEYKNVLKKV